MSDQVYLPTNLQALEQWAGRRKEVGLHEEAQMRMALALEHVALVLLDQTQAFQKTAMQDVVKEQIEERLEEANRGVKFCQEQIAELEKRHDADMTELRETRDMRLRKLAEAHNYLLEQYEKHIIDHKVGKDENS